MASGAHPDLPQFDRATISDVVLHLRYTAREGGGLLRSKAAEFIKKLNALALAENRTGMYRVLDLPRDTRTSSTGSYTSRTAAGSRC